MKQKIKKNMIAVTLLNIGHWIFVMVFTSGHHHERKEIFQSTGAGVTLKKLK